MSGREDGGPAVAAGDVWRVRHSRKGNLTLRFPKALDFATDEWGTAEIIEGKVQYASESNRALQRSHGSGTPGDELTFRTSLVTLIERVDLAAARNGGGE